MKKILVLMGVAIIATSCISKKQYTDLQDEENKLKQKVANAQKDLNASKIDLSDCESEITALKDKIKFLERGNDKLLENVDNLIAVSKSGSENMKTTLTQLGKKDQYINQLRDLNSKKDSINLAVAFNLKKVLPNGLNDNDINVNVEGSKVFISIADKLLFNSGSSKVSNRAQGILTKVAKVVNEYPTMDVMVEGHTDNQKVSGGASYKDNWGLSVNRAAAVVRELQNKYDVRPERLIASGRSEYAPIVDNSTSANRSTNRRTKIVILPKMDQFFDLLDSNK